VQETGQAGRCPLPSSRLRGALEEKRMPRLQPQQA